MRTFPRYSPFYSRAWQDHAPTGGWTGQEPRSRLNFLFADELEFVERKGVPDMDPWSAKPFSKLWGWSITEDSCRVRITSGGFATFNIKRISLSIRSVR